MAAAFAVSLGFGFCSGVAFIAGLSYFQKKRAKQRMNRVSPWLLAQCAVSFDDTSDESKKTSTVMMISAVTA